MSNADLGMTEPDRGDEQEPVLDPKVQESIGRSLKAHYDDLVSAPIPDKFLVLLAQLEAQEQRASAGGTSDERL
ncbi:NepR family anti-sigma factor [Bosea caraganae]|nr:NepR family anti-sigma factor [Bosea caraganae]